MLLRSDRLAQLFLYIRLEGWLIGLGGHLSKLGDVASEDPVHGFMPIQVPPKPLPNGMKPAMLAELAALHECQTEAR
jgi:hypothetical protein